MSVSLKITEEVVIIIKKKYQKYQKDNPMPYVIFFAQFDNTTVSIFKSPKKILYSLTVAGKKQANIEKVLKEIGIDEYEFDKTPEHIKEMKEESKEFLFLEDQIGSDEVGTGDFFGPITVVASLVRKKDLPRLKELGVVDSKKMTDEKIRRVGKIVVKEFKYSSLTLDNKKYNEVVKKGYNMNKIKCCLHNRALFNLHSKFPKITNFYVDQFVESDKYYEYLEKEKNVLHDIYFHTKGETYFPSVALASVIARYSFLEKMDALSKKYKVKIPFGAGTHVDKFAVEFLKKFGQKELDKVVKQNFKNYKKIINEKA